MENVAYLFPLTQTVLFKKVTLPFHIFEPRYIDMIHDSLEREIPIAVVCYHPSDSYRGEICVAGMPHILSTYPDGRLDIYITGEVKCRLTELVSHLPYKTYEYREIPEDVMWGDSIEIEVDSLRIMLERWANQYLPEEVQREAFSNTLEDPEVLVNYCALFLIDDWTIKQEVMKASTLEEKVRRVLQAVGPREISLGPFMPTLRF